MIKEFLQAFFLIFIAEMGDKTQVLAMAFALKYPVKKVLVGIGLGAFLNHALAVILGAYLSKVVDIDKLQLFAGLIFIAFGILTLRPELDDDDDISNKGNKMGPIITVAIAFFIGELGDKTQLTAITLASNAVYPIVILVGTVTGMVITGGLGIYIGKKFGERIPELILKVVSSLIFIFFGVSKLFKNIPQEYLNSLNKSVFVIVIGAIFFILLKQNKISRDLGSVSMFTKRSKDLYYMKLRQDINRVCHGSDKCGGCDGKNCIVGYTKILADRDDNNNKNKTDIGSLKELKNNIKGTNRESDALFSLLLTIVFLQEEKKRNKPDNDEIHDIRKSLETMILGKSIESYSSWKDYYKKLESIDKSIADRINKEVDLV